MTNLVQFSRSVVPTWPFFPACVLMRAMSGDHPPCSEPSGPVLIHTYPATPAELYVLKQAPPTLAARPPSVSPALCIRVQQGYQLAQGSTSL